MKIFQTIAYFSRNRFGIKVFDKIRIDSIAHKLGSPMTYTDVNEVLLMNSFYCNGLEQNTLHKKLEFIRNKIPILVVYGERDKLVLKKDFKQLTQDLGINEKNFYNLFFRRKH